MANEARDILEAVDAGSLLDVAPVAGNIGAEIRGVRLGGGMDDVVVTAVRAALIRHKVIFFRGQHHLDAAEQEAFANLLGRASAHPTIPVAEGSRYVNEVRSKEGEAASAWHTDLTFVPDYPEASILCAIEIPPVGGDTLWANMALGYDRLPAPLRLLADNLRAVHSNLYDYASVKPHATPEQVRKYQEVFVSTVYETEHPVVRVHPESGERTLVLGLFVKKFVGFNQTDSDRLLAMFQEHVTRPENTVRWRWQAGDVAIWDNRATQHRAIADFGRQPRHLRRVTLAGEIPFGIDGSRSRALKPEPTC